MNLFLQLPQWIRALLTGLVLLISAFFIGRCTAPQSTQDKGGVLTIEKSVKTDTIRIPQFIHDTVEIVKPVPTIVYKNRPVLTTQPNGEPTLLHRVYKDEKELIKGVKVGYTAKVSGILDSINLSFIDTRPKILVRDSVFITKTLTKIKQPTGLYLGGFSNQTLTNFGPEVQLVRPKFSLGVGYDVKQAAPQFRIGINLIRDKAK